MSENQSGFSPFNNQGSEPKVEAFKWGFNFKSVKGANTDLTYGWKASGVFGLSTSVYVAPLGIQATPMLPVALTTMVTNSETTYKIAKQWSNWTMMFTHNDITDLSKRWGRDTLMRWPAYMTMEFGSKCDFIFGNKYDYCTGSVNKSVNGETVNCYSDKVEWYYANLYKYIQGTELKMEVKDKKLQVTASKEQNLTKAEVLNDKKSYADNYAINAVYEKSIASKDVEHKAGENLSQVAKEKYTLNAKSIDMTAGGANATITAKAKISLQAAKDISIGSSSGQISMQCGPKTAIVVSSGQTLINNQVSLGMPKLGAIPDVAGVLLEFNKQITALEKDLSAAKKDIAEAQSMVDEMYWD